MASGMPKAMVFVTSVGDEDQCVVQPELGGGIVDEPHGDRPLVRATRQRPHAVRLGDARRQQPPERHPHRDHDRRGATKDRTRHALAQHTGESSRVQEEDR